MFSPVVFDEYCCKIGEFLKNRHVLPEEKFYSIFRVKQVDFSL